MTINYFENIALEQIIRHIDGTADSGDRLAVEVWIGSDQHHAVYFNKIKEAWLDLKQEQRIEPGWVDNDWQQVLARIKTAKAEKEKMGLESSITWYKTTWTRVAAVVVLLLSVAGAYWVGQSSSTSVDRERTVYNEMVVPQGEKSSLVLSDGTRICVNASSKLRFPNRFGGKSREVWLDGEAFFEVAKNRTKPFYVHTNGLNIKVLGTKFNVKAYSNENIIETTLVEGLVALSKNQPGEAKDKEVYLHPNHKAFYLKNKTIVVTEELKREVVEPLEERKIIISKPIQVEPSTSWKEGKLVFDDETLESIAKKLERRYDVTIEINDDVLKEIHYGGVLKNVSVEQAITAIQRTTGFQYTMTGNHIVIFKK
jgi:transmembrane sensor